MASNRRAGSQTLWAGVQGSTDQGARTDTKETEMALALPPFLGSYRNCGPRKVFGADTKGHVLYDSVSSITGIGIPREAEHGLVVARGWGERGWGMMGTGFSSGGRKMF